ncbi:recombinase family protein [Halalkalibacter oceani]|uniref:recombinase family protein n=1 Tax=Halalkalibacter oceani TaxID=1653776 RepID=UPI0033955CD3
MEKVLGYVRVSTETQAEKGYGKEVQESAIQEYCDNNNLSLDAVFRDLGVSGTLLERQGLSGLLTTLSEKDIKTIVVMNTSRLWREDTAKVLIKRELQKMSVNVISIEQKDYNLYSKEPNDFLINGMIELLDQYDRLNINKKLAKGRIQKVKAGIKACGNTPLGYKWKREGVVKPIIVQDKETMRVVQIIFKKYLELKSLLKVQRYLKEENIRTQRGNQFSTMAIKNILNNRFYIGEIKHADLIVKGTHNPIISMVIFGKVQAQLERNKRKGFLN